MKILGGVQKNVEPREKEQTQSCQNYTKIYISIKVKVQLNRLRWLCHISRKGDEELTRKTFVIEPERRNIKGIPRKTW